MRRFADSIGWRPTVALLLAALGACGGADTRSTERDGGAPVLVSLARLAGEWDVTGVAQDGNGESVEVHARSSIASGPSGAYKEQWVGKRGDRTLQIRTLLGPSDTAARWIAARGDGERGIFDVLEGSNSPTGFQLTSRAGSRPDGEIRRMIIEVDGRDAFSLRVEDAPTADGPWTMRDDLRYERAAAGAPMPAPPERATGCQTDAYRSFDFWEGSWAVGAATNDLRSRLGRCILEENWRGNVRGTSYNMFDPRADQWAQVWFDSGGNTLVTFGGPSAGGMQLQGPRRDALERLTWTASESGTVRQLGQTSPDGGSTWNVRYDIVYQRQDTARSEQ